MKAVFIAGLLSVSWCLVSLSPVSAQSEPRPPLDVVALIDDEAVPRAEFEAYFVRYARSKLYHGGSEARYIELRAEATERFIEDWLLLREAVRRDIEGDPEDAERRVQELEARYQGSETWAEVQEQLPRIRQALLDKTKIIALLAEVERVADPDQAALRRFYDANIDLFTTPRADHLAVILLGVLPSAGAAEWREAEVRASELFERIEEGADFAALARERSTHKTAADGGDMGMVHKGELTGAVQETLDGIEPGQATPPIRVLEGLILLKLIDRVPPKIRPFAKVRDRTLVLYKRRLSLEQRDRFVSALRENAVVTVGETENATEEAGGRPVQ